MATLVKASQLCPALCDPVDCSPSGSSVQGILQASIPKWVAIPFSKGSSLPRDRTQEGVPHCWQILYQLSHKGNPRILEWVAYTFSRGSSWPKNWAGVSCIAGRFFTSWATREAQCLHWVTSNTCLLHPSLLITWLPDHKSGDGGKALHRLPREAWITMTF